ncbi:MAG TPA: protein-L-isoaspartate(D-aspartate) O-methyltransferase [Desulfuromonadales bacterium]|nr:protein-L-isoaspartate(D-aspartate) O-methyltransferase [Desulfuromonadales bacterium]
MHQSEIHQMLRTIERECEFTATATGRPALAPRVLEALADVPREQFVPPEMAPYAYADNALPIGEGQTISQPFIVGLMTDLLEPAMSDRVLEIGTGSGYQAAVLSRLVLQVYSIEILTGLARLAEERLERLGFRNVRVRSGDGYQGWAEQAPFDGIIVTAAAPHIPQPLVAQLKPGGHLVIPIGRPFQRQELKVLTKNRTGEVEIRTILGVAFVPLTGDLGLKVPPPSKVIQ